MTSAVIEWLAMYNNQNGLPVLFANPQFQFITFVYLIDIASSWVVLSLVVVVVVHIHI